MSDNDILFPGPDGEYKAPLGNNPERRTSTRTVTADYANQDHLNELLERILVQTAVIVDSTESELDGYGLKVEEDSKLADAHSIEWPEELGEPKEHISYLQYKALGTKQTRSASYIRKSYEDNLRGPSGTNAIDVLYMANALRSEATNIQEFLNASSDINDSSKKRTLELLQDWAENAIFHTGRIRSLYEKREPQKEISTAELDLLSGSQAEQYQALFKVKLNVINNQVASLQEEIKKDHNDLSQAYFGKFLGPALKMRLNATRGLEDPAATGAGQLRKEALTGAAAVNANLSVLIADQLKRNTAFEEKFSALEQRVQDRDQYIAFIRQLEEKGRKVKAMFTDIVIDEEEREIFDEVIATAPPTTNTFQSSHSLLHDIDEPDAHSQYLLKDGDTITGDIAVDDLITVDGVDINEHRHTGGDGTHKIKGTDIEGGTLPPGAADLNEKPATPQNLKVITQSFITVPPGTVFVEAVLGWDGDVANSHEVQITRLD